MQAIYRSMLAVVSLVQARKTQQQYSSSSRNDTSSVLAHMRVTQRQRAGRQLLYVVRFSKKAQGSPRRVLCYTYLVYERGTVQHSNTTAVVPGSTFWSTIVFLP